jgi:hypothetical protein
MFVFAIIMAFAPNDDRRDATDWTCELVRPEGAKPVADTVPPYRIVFTFAIAALLAPKEERIDCTD